MVKFVINYEQQSERVGQQGKSSENELILRTGGIRENGNYSQEAEVVLLFELDFRLSGFILVDLERVERLIAS